MEQKLNVSDTPDAPMIIDALEEDYCGSPYEVDPLEVFSTLQLTVAAVVLAVVLCAVVVLS